jgi:hypothetical protein
MFRKLNKLSTLVISLLCAVAIATGCVVFTSASSEKTVVITSEGQAVDSVTLAGTTVNAYYGFSGNYSCAELVIRFYKEVFGETVNNLDSSSSIPTGQKASFTATNKPVVGDIVRFSDRTHWAIVKSVSGDEVTICEQNWSYYSGSSKVCSVGRTISASGNYTFFHYNGYEKTIKKAVKKAIKKRLTDVEDNKKLQELKSDNKKQVAKEKKFSSDKIITTVLEK